MKKWWTSEAVAQFCSVKTAFLEILQNVQPEPLFFLLKKETLTQVFSYEFCEISKNTIFTEYIRWLLLELLTFIDFFS